jgi:NDP-sugar pyrophosphorylase family protein
MTNRIKQFAIIAAGEGSRLAQEGVEKPKPLVCLNGEPMINRLVRIFIANGAERIAIIVNQLNEQTALHMKQLMAQTSACSIELVVKSTPSSMHSFYELATKLDDAPFCLTTVDTVFKEEDFRAYLDSFSKSDADGMMAVTDFIDDEKPLYVEVDEQMKIRNFCDERSDCRFVSGGIYGLTPRALATLKRCIAEGQHRMRNFQRGLIADGLELKAYRFSKILDVDHATDIQKAEHFLQSE